MALLVNIAPINTQSVDPQVFLPVGVSQMLERREQGDEGGV